jgi:hypothetical protein
MRLWKYLPAVAALACTGIVVAPALPANAAGPVLKVNNKTVLQNAKPAMVVKVTATGLTPGKQYVLIECNSGSDNTGSGCDIGGVQQPTATATGGLPAGTTYTLKGGAIGSDTTLKCLPSDAADITAGHYCALALIDTTTSPPTIIAAAALLDPVKVSAKAVTGGKYKVTCKGFENETPAGGTLNQEKVDILKNGSLVTTLTNINGTVSASITAVAGNTVACKGEKFGQATKVLTLT